MPISFDPSRYTLEKLKRAEVDLRSWSLRYPCVNGFDLSRARWQEWAGADLKQMIGSREATKVYFGHADPGVRRTALCVAASYWSRGSEILVADCLRLAFEDEDRTVRGAALQALSCFRPYLVDRSGWLRRLFDPSADRQSRDGMDPRLEAIKATANKIRTWAAEKARRSVDELAGQFATRLHLSISAARDSLDHADPRIRQAAIIALSFEWKAFELLAVRCEQLACHDPDISVRAEAVRTLGACYAKTDDARVGRLVADMVWDSSAPKDLRRGAYESLLMIRGVRIEAYDKLAEDPDAFDWAFVNSFRPQ